MEANRKDNEGVRMRDFVAIMNLGKSKGLTLWPMRGRYEVYVNPDTKSPVFRGGMRQAEKFIETYAI